MSKSHVNGGLLLLRVGAGLALAAHGYPKLFGGEGKKAPDVVNRLYGKNFPGAVERGGPENFSKGLERMGIPNPKTAAYLSALAEFGGGVALVLGLATRFITTAILINMAVAIRKAHWENGFFGQGGFELAGLFATVAATLWMTGPGKFSLDRLLNHKQS
jgi:putative oxidoreductase